MAARLWNKAPFVRLLAALAVGILLQWHLSFTLRFLGLGTGSAIALLLAFGFLPVHLRYRLHKISGILLFLLVAFSGSLAVWQQDVRNDTYWFGHHYRSGDVVAVNIEEPLIEKANSYKAVASVQVLYHQKKARKVTGKVMLYFKKDSLPPALHYGNRLVLSATCQPISNAGNPGSFDYKTYSLFHSITHQAFLSTADYVVLPGSHTNWFQAFLYNCRAWVIGTLKQAIQNKKEQGLAEALLIGYKDDLDKNLVQAYSNTGVVHIIAISGLHLGLIYWLLLQLTRPVKRLKHLRWVRLLLIISGLWLFSLLAGAGPSVLRSALMFSLIALGDVALRKTTIFHTLSFSAFVLLCINPFWLWDVGFQLSYAAVLSIVLFFQPVYNWFTFSNKGLDFLWKLTAVTLAAQILTLPISIYHFHQMPLLFLLTNFIAVPLSSLILMGLILLCTVSFIPVLANLTGNILERLMFFLNSYIENLDRLPFVTWNALSITLTQCILLTLFALAFCYWLLEKRRLYAWVSFASFALFMALRGVSFFEAYGQKKLIVYNVPKHPAIDIIYGRSYVFLGDSTLLQDGFERNFHLQPSRILHRISPQKPVAGCKRFTLGGKHFLLLDTALRFVPTASRLEVDVLILSKNPKLYLSHLLQTFKLKQVVIDGSVPPWKVTLWKKDCDSLKLPCHDVNEKGAFVMNW